MKIVFYLVFCFGSIFIFISFMFFFWVKIHVFYVAANMFVTVYVLYVLVIILILQIKLYSIRFVILLNHDRNLYLSRHDVVSGEPQLGYG